MGRSGTCLAAALAMRKARPPRGTLQTAWRRMAAQNSARPLRRIAAPATRAPFEIPPLQRSQAPSTAPSVRADRPRDSPRECLDRARHSRSGKRGRPVRFLVACCWGHTSKRLIGAARRSHSRMQWRAPRWVHRAGRGSPETCLLPAS
eukprot:scaffold10244_cov82-Phaeocystis_antarctica.AAC.4